MSSVIAPLVFEKYPRPKSVFLRFGNSRYTLREDRPFIKHRANIIRPLDSP